MPRARNIKPGFFQNEDLVELPFETRLLFIGLWTLADREGRLEDRPKRIKMQIFPADNTDVDTMLDSLAATGMIERYSVENNKYIQVVSFRLHQNPHKAEKDSDIPPVPCEPVCGTVQAPDEQGASTVLEPDEQGGNPADSLIPDSLIPDSTDKPIVGQKPNAVSSTVVVEVIQFLNDKTGKNFQAKHPNGDMTKSGELVKSLLKKGYEVEDVKMVTARMCREWLEDEKMCGHLTPATLYRPSNFEKYLGKCV